MALNCCGGDEPRGKIEHCPGGKWGGCCQSFSNTRAGDRHRTGPHGARRCLPPDEVGLVYDETRGVWRLPPSDSMPFG